jgi:hypothetical protein
MHRAISMTTSAPTGSPRPALALVVLAAGAVGLGVAVLGAVAWAFAPPESSERSPVTVSAEPQPEDGAEPPRWTPRRVARRSAASSVEDVPSPALEGAEPDVLGPYGNDAADPQLARSRASSRGLDAGVAGFARTDRLARVVSVSGAAPVGAGARCDVRVLPVVAGGFNCLLRVVCDGVLLYPNPEQTAGYVTCEVDAGSPVAAVDDAPTHRDGDPWLTLDLRGGRVRTGDETADGRSFAVELRIEDARTLRRR